MSVAVPILPIIKISLILPITKISLSNPGIRIACIIIVTRENNWKCLVLQIFIKRNCKCQNPLERNGANFRVINKILMSK